MTYFNNLGQGRVGFKAPSGAVTPSTLWSSIYSVWNADTLGASLDSSIFRVYNGDNVNDTSGNAQNGTNVNGVTFTTGKVGNAFTFNGSNYIQLPDNSLNSLTGDFSISAWIYLSGTHTGMFSYKVLENTSANTWFNNPNGVSLAIDGYTINFDIYNNTNTYRTLSYGMPGGFVINTWYHVAVTRKSGTGSKIYLNGSLVTSNTNTVDPTYLATISKPCIGALNIPARGSVGYYAANGNKLDALNVWTKELSAEEIFNLYNDGAGAEYPFTSQTLASLKDSVGSNHGTRPASTLTGGVLGPAFTTGKIGKAFSFDGINDCVSLPDNMFNSLTGDFSINMWVNIVNTGSLQTLLSCKAYDGANAWGFSLFNYGTSRFDITNGSTSVVTLQDPDGSHNTYGTWYMVTVTRKASTGTKIYYNGTLAASNTSTQNIVFNPTTNKCAIGAYVLTYPINTGIYYYAGNGTKIDEVNVWTKQLTSTEVTELYNAGNGKQYPTT